MKTRSDCHCEALFAEAISQPRNEVASLNNARNDRGGAFSSWVLIMVAMFLWVSTSFSQVAKEVHKVLQEQVDAWNRGDIEGFMQGYWKSDSTVFVSGGEINTGWQNLLERYKRTYGTKEKMGRLEFSELSIRLLSANAALAYGVWRLYRASDEPWGRFTLIVEKKPEGWRITQDHTSSGER